MIKVIIYSLLTSFLMISSAASLGHLPRNQHLHAFDPHRKDFVCKHEANAVPPIDAEANQWFEEGLRITNHTLWPDDRNYKRAAVLWQQAADRKHWKAMLNLANAYAYGEGVTRDSEHAVQIAEAAMDLGIPAAYDLMGLYHMEGIGVKQDASRAYAFWELAADLGSASAQAYLGAKLRATYDDPSHGFWDNRKIGLKMLECGYAQGNGKAAFALGATIIGTRKEYDEDNARALRILQDGVKLGSSESANALFASFDNGEQVVGKVKDRARAQRYFLLGRALELDPDLRLPNLDKVLPLPPAALPQWNGNKQQLIEAAKAVVRKAAAGSDTIIDPGSNVGHFAESTGRAGIPAGWALPDKLQTDIQPQYETTRAPASGYWLARLMHASTDRHHAWNSAQQPLRYEAGELFDRSRPGLAPEDGRIRFHYLGQPENRLTFSSPEDTLLMRGVARSVPQPVTELRQSGDQPCPETGIWAGCVDGEHPMALVFNRYDRQAYVSRGDSFPNPKLQHLEIAAADVQWHWLGDANQVRGEGRVHLTLNGLMAVDVPADADGSPGET